MFDVVYVLCCVLGLLEIVVIVLLCLYIVFCDDECVVGVVMLMNLFGMLV